MAAGRPDRRVVDRVEAGNAESEATHGYAGHDAEAGVADGRTFRQARGWMRYALTTFDDTEVTVACTFVGTDSVPRSYDVVVEDSLIATRTLAPGMNTAAVVEFSVPFVLTRGKSNIAVVVRARGGSTPALQTVRTVQDHNEVDHHHNEVDHHHNEVDHPGVVPTLSFPHSLGLPGVVR
jgi:hypothetical protein